MLLSAPGQDCPGANQAFDIICCCRNACPDYILAAYLGNEILWSTVISAQVEPSPGSTLKTKSKVGTGMNRDRWHLHFSGQTGEMEGVSNAAHSNPAAFMHVCLQTTLRA